MSEQAEQRSRDYLDTLFQGDQRAVLAFSGGKDSLVLADLCRPYKDRIILAWVNTGAMFPHMEAFIRGYAADWQYVEIPSDVRADITESGWPAYMVPAANVAPQHPLEWLAGSVPPELRMQPWHVCCFKSRVLPMLAYVERSGADLVLHGIRGDEHGGRFEDIEQRGLRIAYPLRGWTERDVFEYIDRHGIALPEQYGAGYANSLECRVCTAMEDLGNTRWKYLEKHHPADFEVVRRQAEKINAAVNAEFAGFKEQVGRILDAGNAGREGTDAGAGQ